MIWTGYPTVALWDDLSSSLSQTNAQSPELDISKSRKKINGNKSHKRNFEEVLSHLNTVYTDLYTFIRGLRCMLNKGCLYSIRLKLSIWPKRELQGDKSIFQRFFTNSHYLHHLTMTVSLQHIQISDDFVMEIYWTDLWSYFDGYSWWQHDMETPSALLTLCEGNPRMTSHEGLVLCSLLLDWTNFSTKVDVDN